MILPERKVDVQSFLDQHPFSPFQWLILTLCFLVVLLDGFDTAAIGYIAPSLLAQWHIPKPALAPVLSAALFGLSAGALCAGPLADRLGRKSVLVSAVIIIGIASLLAASSTSLSYLVMWRFLTGLGLGAAMPNAVTLVSEYCPASRRATLTNAMFCGFPLGAACGGFLAAWMIPLWGWRSVLVLGGCMPLALAAAMLILLPESARYMVATNQPVERIRRVLNRISASVADASGFVMAESSPAMQSRSGVGLVLSRPYLIGSVMLWLAYFMGLVIFYGLINWMPTLFHGAGLDTKLSALITALFPLGGVGAIFAGWLMDRFNPSRIVAAAFALTAVAVWGIGQTSGDLGLLMFTVFVGGALMNTAQTSLPALAARFYPTNGRATGVAWMMGLGRLGGIAGSFLVAELTRLQLGFSGIFGVVALAGLLAALALIIKQIAHPEPVSAGITAADEVLGH